MAMPPIEVLDALRKKALLKVLAILREHKKREGWKDASL